MKLITIIGARPQFIKAATVSKAIQAHNVCNASRIQEIIIHTGQHYDENMSKVFFTELEIPHPDYNLGIAAATHGAMTGQMLEQLEIVLLKEKPDIVLIYGDTNSTLAGALAAVKLHIPVAHVEAGLRSFNMLMPEEINRILADRISHLLFCPTETAVSNLAKESIINGVYNVGDVMYDITLRYRDKAYQAHPLQTWKLEEKAYALCTIHRAENTNDSIRLKNILTALQQIAQKMAVILPLHPRTRKLLKARGEMHLLDGLQIIEPVSYF
jgi:UDP-GlcNAc3NAcA epimerase